MSDSEQFTMGTAARCREGSCGEVSRVVIDPVLRAVTHLVIEPTHRKGLGRLVPLALVESVDGEVEIHCTREAFDKLDAAEETEYLPGTSYDQRYANGYGAKDVYYQPYFRLGGAGMAFEETGMGMGNTTPPITRDVLPPGEVAVRRGEQVHAVDGAIGKVRGLVIDPRDQRVTHVLLEEGHLWGRKEVAIPISAVATVDDGIRLNIALAVVKDLPPVDVDQLNGS